MFSTFIHGFRLDLSATAYLSVVPILLWGANLILNKGRIFRVIYGVYAILILIILILINVSDLQIYSEWGYKLNDNAIKYLQYPKEAMASISSSPIWLLLIIALVQAVAAWYAFKLIMKNAWEKSKWLPGSKLAVRAGAFSAIFLVICGCDGVLIRGGVQLAAINQSAAYFSDKQLLNHTALNTSWNLMYYLTNKRAEIDVKDFTYMPQEKAAAIMDSLYGSQATANAGIDISKIKRPNIVLIILESWTSDAIECLGGVKGITPEFDKLTKQGLLFDNFYASGDRTGKGVMAVLSGFPVLPRGSLITEPSKFEKLPSLTGSLKKAGYSASFIYGGESEFANMRSYLVSTGFHTITDKNNFDSRDMNSKWGAHDGVVLDKALNDIAKAKSPFFTTILTLSSHEPFEIPVKDFIKGDDTRSRFLNSIRYADKCLGDFFEKASKASWYDSTLFLVVADHGHRAVNEFYSNSDPGKFRIPFLITGGALPDRLKGERISTLACQKDIPKSILVQLGIPSDDFTWSKDAFNARTPHFVYYSFDTGYGWVSPTSTYAFDNISKQVVSKSQAVTQKELEAGQAHLQRLIEVYKGL